MFQFISNKKEHKTACNKKEKINDELKKTISLIVIIRKKN